MRAHRCRYEASVRLSAAAPYAGALTLQAGGHNMSSVDEPRTSCLPAHHIHVIVRVEVVRPSDE